MQNYRKNQVSRWKLHFAILSQPTDLPYTNKSLVMKQLNRIEEASLLHRLSRQNYNHSILSGTYLHSYYNHQNSTCWLDLGQTAMHAINTGTPAHISKLGIPNWV